MPRLRTRTATSHFHATRRYLLALGALLTSSQFADAANIWNINAGGSWGTPANWTGGNIPSAPGDTAVLGLILTNPAGAVITLDGDRTAGTLAFNNSAATYTLAQGTGGTLFLQAGTTGPQTAMITVQGHSNILDVPVSAASDLLISATSNPNLLTSLIMDQSIQALNSVTVAAGGAAVADFILNGTAASVSAPTIVVGASGTARLTLNGGSLAAANSLTFNGASTGVADFILNASSSVTAPTMVVGGTGTARLTLNGGILAASNSLTFNGSVAAVADFTLNGTTSSVTAGAIVVGGSAGTSRLTINGGTLVASETAFSTSALLMGSADGSNAYLKLNSGSINVGSEFWLGERSTNSSYSAFTMTGGSVTTASYFVVGNVSDRAVFNMSNGVFTVQNAVMTIGAGYPLGNGTGVANISGGTVTSLGTQAGGGIFVGEIGTGVLNISNTAQVIVSQIQFGNHQGLNSTIGIVNLNGGTLTAGTLVQQKVNTALFNFNGGVLKALNSTSSFLAGISPGAYVYPAGAIIDDGGNSVSFSLPLQAPTGKGVATIPVTGGTGYLDTPLVQITNAVGDTNGIGATAVANVDTTGKLTSITITSPGMNYALPPIVTLTGGGGSGAIVGSTTLATNTSGGFTKLGTGTLTLNSVSTYTGPTNVNAGTLIVNGALSLTSAVFVQGGAGLTGLGSIHGPVTLAAGTTPDTQGAIASDSQVGTLTLSGGLIAGGTQGTSTLNFDIGSSSGGADRVNLATSSFSSNGNGTVVKLNNVGGAGPGTYTLMSYTNASAPSNVTLDPASAHFSFSNASLSISTTAVAVVVSALPFPAAAYWTGTYGNAWTASGGPANDQANFVMSATGSINTLQVPGPTTDVYFSSATAGPGNVSTQFGQNFIIKSLNVSPGSSAVTINGPHLLQLVSGVVTVGAGSGGLTLNSDIAFPGAQNWTNNASLPLVINSALRGSTSASFTSNGDVQLDADWSTYFGTLTIASGTFQMGNGGTSGSFGIQTSAAGIAPRIIDNGTLVFNRLGTSLPKANGSNFQYHISGTGAIVFNITGSCFLNISDNTCSGPTTIASGTVTITNVSDFGASPLVTISGGALAIPNNINFNKNLAGVGDLIDTCQYGTVTLSAAQSFSGTTTVLASSPGVNDLLIITGTSSHSIGIVTGGGNFQVAANTTLTSDGVTVAAWYVNGTHVIRANGSPSDTSKVNSLTLASSSGTFTATLDLTNNKIILQSDPTLPSDKPAKLSFLQSALLSGAHNGDWLGTGIVSSSVAADQSATGSHLTALALYDNADLNLPTFGGQPVDSSSLFITTARIADANFDATVNNADLAIVSSHWLTPQNAWSRGDFNYDGTTNAADLTLLANNWQDPQPYPLAVVGFANLATSLGTVTLTANSTYAGTTTIAAGTLIIGNASTSGFAGTGPIINHGQLAFNRSDAVFIPNQITGTGTLSHIGTGTTTLSNYQGTGPLTLTAGKLAFSPTPAPRNTPAVLLQAASLSLAPSTTLDLSNHDLLLHNANPAQIESLIASAYNFGLWTHPGITSSTAQSNPTTTLAIMSGADYNTFSPTPGTFDGTPVASTDTVLKFTYVGDLNLDGLVNDDDLFIFNGAYFFGGTGNYALGDLNFDGLVNDDDLFLFNGNYFFPPATTLADLSLLSPSQIENQNSKIENLPTPEPTTLLLLTLATPLLLLRRPRIRYAHLLAL